MPDVVRNMPFDPPELLLRFPGGVSQRHPRQIVFWVSLRAEASDVPPDQSRYFPAVFDTGFNDSFLIQPVHLQRWALVEPTALPHVSNLLLPNRDSRGRRRTASVLRADLWIHPNVPGSHKNLLPVEPFRIELANGVAVVPQDLNYPRLPLLGLRIFESNPFEFVLNSASKSVSIRY
ncbi:MAG: hypothetical protein HYS13_03090 [Planctomycetia bacterium]|nr:hypothetical protein [Planctomycetia bacterium]